MAQSLRSGTTGDAVRDWQQFLVAHGFDIPIDGDFGDLTEAATRKFQEETGLSVDGVVGKRTRAERSRIETLTVTQSVQAVPDATAETTMAPMSLAPVDDFSEFSPAMQAQAARLPNVAAKLREIQSLRKPKPVTPSPEEAAKQMLIDWLPVVDPVAESNRRRFDASFGDEARRISPEVAPKYLGSRGDLIQFRERFNPTHDQAPELDWLPKAVKK